jgi:protein ImuB
VRFTWRRVDRRIMRSEGPERIAPEWWRSLHHGPERKPPRPRAYYAIEDKQGARYWVFRHGLYRTGGGDEDDHDHDQAGPPEWFLHGLFA